MRPQATFRAMRAIVVFAVLLTAGCGGSDVDRTITPRHRFRLDARVDEPINGSFDAC
jgi:hypothetical protein